MRKIEADTWAERYEEMRHESRRIEETLMNAEHILRVMRWRHALTSAINRQHHRAWMNDQQKRVLAELAERVSAWRQIVRLTSGGPVHQRAKQGYALRDCEWRLAEWDALSR